MLKHKQCKQHSISRLILSPAQREKYIYIGQTQPGIMT